jgi:hypothetical protein
MSRAWTKTEAFDRSGTRLTNTRWSWSGISPAGDVVALVLLAGCGEAGTVD